MGRFNRLDPYDGSYDLTNPGSLNRYSYALNNPILFTDRSGLFCEWMTGPRTIRRRMVARRSRSAETKGADGSKAVRPSKMAGQRLR